LTQPPAPPPSVPAPSPVPPSDVAAKLGDIAAGAGLERIHLIAWRDLDDVEAGGSEVHAANVARLWAEAGIEVLLRTSWAQGHPNSARRDGYEVVRKGGRYQVFPRTALSEIRRANGPRDGLVEIWNGMPFFSPLWATGPKVVVMHHVHADMWRMVLPPRLATMGDVLERRVAPWLYHWSRMITLSPSSRDEMLEIGFPPGNVEVVPPGVDPRFSPGAERTAAPSVLAAGRLVPVKRYDMLIRAVVEARRSVPDLTLTIVGTGPLRGDLEELVASLEAGDAIRFAGWVSDDDLLDLYRRSWLVASASAREGWGMTLTEAAACATPAVATRIAGHADAVVEGVTGLLVDDEQDLAAGIVSVTTDAELRERLRAGALQHAQRFTWDATATSILSALATEARRWHSRPWRRRTR
jgi:glycosyltransferase involved in cell wall biosynthesis